MTFFCFKKIEKSKLSYHILGFGSSPKTVCWWSKFQVFWNAYSRVIQDIHMSWICFTLLVFYSHSKTSLPHNDKVLTCCNGMLYPARENVVCCNNELLEFDGTTEMCCEDQVIDLSEQKCCDGTIYDYDEFCPYVYVNPMQPFFDWFQTRFIGWIPHLEAMKAGGKKGKKKKGPVG